MLLLGFGAKARQGKDTAAEAIRDYYDRRNVHLQHVQTRVGVFKFATALYQEVNKVLGNQGSENFFRRRKVWVGPTRSDFIDLPNWVQPEPNPEISDLAPYGKHSKLLQWWGTEFRRAQDPDYWTKKLFASIPANLDIAIVTDVRFPNEVDGIKQRGGYTVNVQRLREDGTPYFSSDRSVDHPSETALDGYNWDFYIKTKEVVLKGEMAITLAEYLHGLEKK